jgi:hypothetical protein
MRTWVKATIGGFVIIAVAFAALMATGAYFVFRNMEQRKAAEVEATREIDSIKARFGNRPPLVEITDPVRGDIRINQPTETSATRVNTVHIANWKSTTGEFMRADAPLWLLRLSSINIASRLGLAPDRFRLTVDDIQRYGPGIIADYGSPGKFRILVWVE